MSSACFPRFTLLLCYYSHQIATGLIIDANNFVVRSLSKRILFKHKKIFMKKKFEKIGLMLLAVAIFLSCNDAADTDSDYEDSLRRDSIDRADMTTTVTDTVAKQDGDAQWVSEVLESNYAEIAFAKQA